MRTHGALQTTPGAADAYQEAGGCQHCAPGTRHGSTAHLVPGLAALRTWYQAWQHCAPGTRHGSTVHLIPGMAARHSPSRHVHQRRPCNRHGAACERVQQRELQLPGSRQQPSRPAWEGGRRAYVDRTAVLGVAPLDSRYVMIASCTRQGLLSDRGRLLALPPPLKLAIVLGRAPRQPACGCRCRAPCCAPASPPARRPARPPAQGRLSGTTH